MTKTDAKRLFDSGWWRHVSIEEAAMWQLFERRLCMPFDVFHQGIEKVLSRSVFTHEFTYVEQLQMEALGQRERPTFQEILALIPAHKRIVVEV